MNASKHDVNGNLRIMNRQFPRVALRCVQRGQSHRSMKVVER